MASRGAQGEAAIQGAVPGARLMAFGHVGDGNLHFNLSEPAGGGDARVRVWDMRTREMVSAFSEHMGPITGLCIYRDDAHVLSCSRDKSFICWDLRKECRVSQHVQRMGALHAIAEQMGNVLYRMSYSSIIRESQDLGAGLFDLDYNTLCESDSTPMHIGSIPGYLRGIEKSIPKTDWNEGDVVIHNHPYFGASHSPDIGIVMLGGHYNNVQRALQLAARLHHPAPRVSVRLTEADGWATVTVAGSRWLKVGTPFRWLYWPVRMVARLGVQMEFTAKQRFSRSPCAPSRSMFGVRATLSP
mgnify:CR=1 FL=1